MIEMGPRGQSATTVPRARATAWQTLDSIGETVITVDVNECIDYLNQAAENLLGIPAGQAIGRSLSELVWPLEDYWRRYSWAAHSRALT